LVAFGRNRNYDYGNLEVAMNTDRIQKRILLHAPLPRVWQAISDSRRFGTWFGVAFDGPFLEGTRVAGKIVPTAVDQEVAKLQQPHVVKSFEFSVERVEPMRRIYFRWHPYAIDPSADYSEEPTTLITFELEEQPNGTQLTITESGFDRIPLGRRAAAFTANDAGWEHQVMLIQKYLAMAADG
jgi:uncharacterized protein YndB with AHSA1/START domain